MSGSTIGGVVGGVIGWFVGGPAGAQWGFMIGSAVGAIVAPEQFEGPRLGEAKTQTANDGVPLIYGYGTFPCAGNLAWVDEVKEHRKKESAKGGPETITYTYTVSYMIVVCQGEISGYKLIKRNGKIVYDARTDAELSELGYTQNEIAETRASQASFLQRATLYYGTQTQMPDPTMVAVEGAGNVPAYTGIAYIVLKDDETREGEVSQYEFVVASCGERREDVGSYEVILISGAESPSGERWARSPATAVPEFELIPGSDIQDAEAHTPAFYGGVFAVARRTGLSESEDGLESFHSATFDWDEQPYRVTGGPAGWATWPLANGSINAPVVGQVGGNYYAFAQGSRSLHESPDLLNWTKISDGLEFPGQDWLYAIQFMYDIQGVGDVRYAAVRVNFSDLTARYQVRRSNDSGVYWPDMLVDVPPDGGGMPYQIEIVTDGDGNLHVVALGTGVTGVWTSANGYAAPIITGISAAEALGWNLPRHIASGGGHVYIVGTGVDANKLVVGTFGDDGLTFGAPITLPFYATGIAAGSPAESGALVRIPDAPGFYIDRETGEIIGPSGTQVDPCAPSLGEIVADQCARRGVSSRDVSELTDDVGGYRIAAPSTPQRNIQGLQPGYFFSASEFDGTLHFPKRGRAMTFALTHDDFVERDGDPIQWERTQEPELLRKVTVGYVDPETTYIATTQAAERRSATISAEGESTTELAVTGSRDWAAQVADKSMKVAWGEPDECTFHVSIEHAELVTGAEGTVPYTDGTATAIRIDRIEDEGLVRMVTGRRTRANLYESNASGVAKPLPRFPGSNIRGPTDSVLMNLPIMNDANDSLGLTWAAAGMTSGWVGSQLQVLRAGQWQVAAEITSPCGMGTLLSSLPFHAGDFDGTNVLHIRFSEDLESVTYEALLTERNPIAVVYPDGTSEIVQFQIATEIAPGEYELTNLIRGNLDTTKGAHDAGARVVFLDAAVQWVPLHVGDIGQTLQFRAVSLGTDPDAAPIFPFELTVAESQREWAVAEFSVVQDGDDFHLSWIPRHRLGTDVSPVRSANWDGYVVGWQYGGQMHQESTQADSITFTLPGASDIDFRVVQINRITGEGTQTTVNIP